MTDATNAQRQLAEFAEQLRSLGWNGHFGRSLAAMDTGPGRVARVISAQRNLFLVADGAEERLCPPSGRILHAGDDYPVTGDWVLTDGDVIRSILPRMNILSRGEAGSRNGRSGTALREQPLAANLDMVFIVCGLDRDFNLRRLERYLTLVYNCGLAPLVALTKADLLDDPEAARRQVEDIAFGVPVVLASMLDDRGRDELASRLGPGRTVAMLGSSGAGKSTLANRLYGGEIQATGRVSDSVGKGRHTTTARELIRMPGGGLLMDNPGIREVALYLDGDGVEKSFADIAELAEGCRFADCSHESEPGCAVLRAVELGRLPPERLESYRRMEREMRYVAERRDKSANRVEKERWKPIAKLTRKMK
ncbi:ribosome small subunit-dependent GTPase A [Pseudodesulfovibrio sp.]|uniref:ribosome small subunit-dependent GTPase A n=1 Tax=Pseudodesulfovibrio sp. TaxID=2035812 RepID=UPI0026107CB5|nr:ribosome small subunit-dependent GTPase A [Pseudodesulfovibrio sp.]MDD3312003.1 ribosome small subunit-dependent GTPase A [Pseudodesulfovibrio sp.]